MLHWQLSEHSFLINFAEFSETSSFYSYCWNEGKDWPKFNFIRFKDEAHVDIDELNKFIKNKIASNESVNLKLGVKTPFPEKLAYKATMAGTPISFVSTDASDFLNYKQSSNSVHEVKTIEQLKAWWIVNSGGQRIENPFQGPLWQAIEKISLEENLYYLVKDNNQNDIACFALTKFAENSFNLFGVAILPEHQGKGHLNDIYYFIGKNFTDTKIYGQINIDAKTLLKRLKLKSTVVHAIERRFIIES